MVDIEISGLWVNSSIGGWTSSSQLQAFIKQLISAEQKGILWAYRLWTYIFSSPGSPGCWLTLKILDLTVSAIM